MSPKLLVLCCLCVLTYFTQVADSAPTQGSGQTCSVNGKTFNHGDYFKIDCNSCICGVNGRAACTKMMCLRPSEHH